MTINATLPSDATVRKAVPIATGCVDYFPRALAEVAALSRKGNEQHNPGQPLHWDRSKSTDEADALMRHFVDRGTFDTDGVRHSAKVAWRALALLQKELEAEDDKVLDEPPTHWPPIDRSPVAWWSTVTDAVKCDEDHVPVPHGLLDALLVSSKLKDARNGSIHEFKNFNGDHFVVGETVNTVNSAVGAYPGIVRGFEDDCVLVKWECAIRDESLAKHKASELRHGS